MHPCSSASRIRLLFFPERLSYFSSNRCSLPCLSTGTVSLHSFSIDINRLFRGGAKLLPKVSGLLLYGETYMILTLSAFFCLYSSQGTLSSLEQLSPLHQIAYREYMNLFTHATWATLPALGKVCLPTATCAYVGSLAPPTVLPYSLFRMLLSYFVYLLLPPFSDSE